MELGEKLKQARLAAGLSQRQLCGDRLTRNMLSQIENGSARPSMGTLEYLAHRLEKPVSSFLNEDALLLPNRQVIEDARTALALKDPEGLRRALDGFREPDPVFFEERQLLEFLWRLEMGRKALEEGRHPYARDLLREALELSGLYITRPLERRCRVLLGLAGEAVALESDDESLLVLASEAREPERQLEILRASGEKEDPRWQGLAGEALFQLKRYEEAARCFEQATPSRKNWSRLEECFREMEDYKQAYEYACKLRQTEEPYGQL